ncbi:hypothetical protein F-M6_0062 [Faustovirus]|nr:hypothetical protein F-M6_0062 [Faustovirus]
MKKLDVYLATMLPDGAKYDVVELDLSKRQPQARLLKLVETNPVAAVENLLAWPRALSDFKEVFARVKRIRPAREFQAIIDKFTYQICSVWEYYIVCSGWLTDIKMAISGAIDSGNKEITRRLLSEYPNYASVAIKRAFRMLELDIGELACRYDETFAVSLEIERGVCKHILHLQTRGIEPLWEELSHLHAAPLRANCLPIRYAAQLDNSRAINTLISHEINTKGGEMRNINMDLVNTAVAACALFNSVESLWLMITYYYSHALDGLAAKAASNALYRIMDAKPNKSIEARTKSAKYAQIGVSSMRPVAFISKLLLDITIAANYESWVVLFYYLVDDNDTFMKLPEIITPIIPYMTQKMIRAFGDLVPASAISALNIETKRALFRQCLHHSVAEVAAKTLEWDEEILNIAAYYNYNVINELILLYTANNSLSKSESSAGSSQGNDDSIEYEQMAKLCLSERVRFRSRARPQLDATLAMACYIIKANATCAKILLANNYCFYVDKSNLKLRSAIDEYGNDEIKTLFASN